MQEINTNRQDFKKGDVIKHFKRETVDQSTDLYLYEYIGIARNSENFDERVVVYMTLYDNIADDIHKGDIFTRPYEMFMSTVDTTKYPEIKQKYRFEKN